MAFMQTLAIGSEVACTTRLGKNVEGKVIALDEDYHVIVVQSFTSSGDPGKSDLHIVNLNNVSSLKIMKVGEGQPVMLPSLSIQKIQKRFQENVSAKEAEISRIGKNVTPMAQKLFDDLYRKLPNQQCCWNNDIIIALGDVQITPPYDSSCCTGDNKRSVEIIKKYVQKFHNERKDTTADN